MTDRELHFETFFGHTKDTVLITDASGIIQYMNPAGESMLNHPGGTVPDRPVDEVLILENDKKKRIGDLLKTQVIKERRDVDLRDCSVERGDGTTVKADLHITPLGDEKRCVGTMITLHHEYDYGAEAEKTSRNLEVLIKERTAELLISLDALDKQVREDERLKISLKQSEQRYRSLFEDSGDAIFIVHTDGSLIDVNRAALELFGYPRKELMRSRISLLYADVKDRVKILKKLKEEGSVQNYELAMRGFEGREITCLLTASARKNRRGRILEYQEIYRDVTESIRSAKALKLSEERYALAARGANDGLWDWDLNSDEIYYSPRWKEILGLTGEDIGNTVGEWFTRVHLDDYPNVKSDLNAHLLGDTSRFTNEHRILHKAGHYLWVLCRGLVVRDESGVPQRIAGSLTDITQRKTLEEETQSRSFKHPLTGLPNFTCFVREVEKAFHAARKESAFHFGISILTLNRFSSIRQRLGRKYGDRLLVQFSRRVSEQLDPVTHFAHLEGEEFALLFQDARSAREIKKQIYRINSALETPFRIKNTDIFLSLIVGSCLMGRDQKLPGDLIRNAECALDRARSLGGPQHVVFDRGMKRHTTSLLQLEADLQRALKKKEFELYYQPILSLKSGTIDGFEGLIRWNHPTRGILLPDRFIQLAEKTGLITSINLWVLEEGCRQLAEWTKKSPPRATPLLSLNLSGLMFLQPDLVLKIERILRSHRVSGTRIKFEITESFFIENVQYIKAILKYIRELDIRLCIDDFGTGYSSLSYLSRFPVDTLKIDRSFIERIDGDRESREIVKTIINLGHTMHMDVVAEGIETADQLAHLKKMKCDLGQGLFFSGAVNNLEAESFIQHPPRW